MYVYLAIALFLSRLSSEEKLLIWFIAWLKVLKVHSTRKRSQHIKVGCSLQRIIFFNMTQFANLFFSTVFCQLRNSFLRENAQSSGLWSLICEIHFERESYLRAKEWDAVIKFDWPKLASKAKKKKSEYVSQETFGEIYCKAVHISVKNFSDHSKWDPGLNVK